MKVLISYEILKIANRNLIKIKNARNCDFPDVSDFLAYIFNTEVNGNKMFLK